MKVRPVCIEPEDAVELGELLRFARLIGDFETHAAGGGR